LQQLLGIFQHVPNAIRGPAQKLAGQLCRYLDPCDRRVFGHVANLIDADARIAGKGCLDVLGECGGFGVARGKGSRKLGELCLSQVRGKMDAGDP
jgi:hypothetical protein